MGFDTTEERLQELFAAYGEVVSVNVITDRATGRPRGFAFVEMATDAAQAAGHEVYTPTLTGLGEREHLASRDVGLDTHITDIVNVLRFEDLWDVINVGGSYGGMIITGMAERMPERLSHLLYLDACVPRDGEAVVDLYPSPASLRTDCEAMLAAGTWRVPYKVAEAWKLVDHPVRTVLQPLAVRSPVAAAIPRTFIYCAQTPDEAIQEIMGRTAQRAREAGWRYRELPTGHCALWTMPEETARLFLEVAAEIGA